MCALEWVAVGDGRQSGSRGLRLQKRDALRQNGDDYVRRRQGEVLGHRRQVSERAAQLHISFQPFW